MTDNLDLNKAKHLRDDEKRTIAVVKDGDVIYQSERNGIFPLYFAYDSHLDFTDASAADKVIGKGAAIFFVKLNIKYLDTIVISKSALEYLQMHNVVVSYRKLVDYIENRTKDGKCPVETMTEKFLDFDTFLNDVKRFLKRLEII